MEVPEEGVSQTEVALSVPKVALIVESPSGQISASPLSLQILEKMWTFDFTADIAFNCCSLPKRQYEISAPDHELLFRGTLTGQKIVLRETLTKTPLFHIFNGTDKKWPDPMTEAQVSTPDGVLLGKIRRDSPSCDEIRDQVAGTNFECHYPHSVEGWNWKTPVAIRESVSGKVVGIIQRDGRTNFYLTVHPLGGTTSSQTALIISAVVFRIMLQLAGHVT